jgi:uncharacterized protein YkwD
MPRADWLAINIVISASLIAGCPQSDSALLNSIASDPLVGRAPAAGDDSNADNGTTTVSEDSSTFEARLVAEFPDCGETSQAQAWKARVVELVNNERANVGLSPVAWNETLAEEATQYACEMIHYDFFDHVNPVTRSTLSIRANQFQYDYLVIGENLAAGQRTPEQAMSDWMDSPGHRQNILDPRFVELGVGVRIGGDYGTYWVQEFGLPGK